ncbi:hypothetical protein NH340_JMT07229 [Sarcoptes scabiei]|nr:hypothetical protein NH340_JMT07229 [Sarcoptes scabiei]
MFSLSSQAKLNLSKLNDSNLREKIEQWLRWDKDPKTWNEIHDLIKVNDFDRLAKLLLERQCFGTAGIRGIMAAGFNSMNRLVVLQTSQGLAKYLASLKDHKETKEKYIVIGFDGRYNSKDFARLSAKVFQHLGFNVYLFSRLVPTPFVAFATKFLNAECGIMITASHNPKSYNGYKVFNKNGAQILSPDDQNIQNSILENLDPWCEELWSIDDLVYNERLIDPSDRVMKMYYEQLKRSILIDQNQIEQIGKAQFRITFTPLHGVGNDYLIRMFQELGYQNYFPVLSQADPDPEFSTVDFPNPEEGQGVFDEAFKTALQNDCRLVFANDPDSDRFCMAERQPNNDWRVFNGNEIGAILGWWQIQRLKQSTIDSSSSNLSDYYLISSAVSSKILETFAKYEGFNFVETLTGFKWMGNLAFDLEHRQKKKVLLCFEEAIGFMIDTLVYDKDGISASAYVLHLASYLEKHNQTFAMLLESIYRKYGLHYSYNSYFLCYDPIKIRTIFERIPDIDGPNQYLKSINGTKTIRIRDLLRRYDSSTVNNECTLPKTCMITLYFENGSVITFRTSGTEPKIKFYSEIVAKPNQIDWDLIRQEHQKLVSDVVDLVLEPKKNDLKAKE